MSRPIALALTAVVSAALGAGGFQALHAQVKPVAYVIYENERTTANQEAYAKEFVPVVRKSVLDYGGKLLRGGGALPGGKTLSVAGEPPKQIVMFQFESLDKAQEWANSSAVKEILPIGQKYSSYFRIIAVEGLPQ